MTKHEEYILEMKNIRKEFYGGKIVANDNINLKIKKGEIHAIVGENGAGKSTLMKILNGLYDPTSGEIYYKGKKVDIKTPSVAANLGIGMVYQHFMLVEPLTVADNMVLGVEPEKFGIYDSKKAADMVRKVSKQYGLNIDPDMKISDLSVGIQQRVEILKILFKGAELLVFDEPSAVLTPQEVIELYGIMRNLIKEGKTIIFITHKLQEVLDLSDNITVIRAGKDVGTLSVKEATKEKIATMMVGRQVLFNLNRKEDHEFGETLVKVNNLKANNDLGHQKVKNISFEIKKGEILGIAGVEGNGQTELIEVLAGLRHGTGEYYINNINMLNKTPKFIRSNGLSHIPEDRHKRATINEFNISENLILGTMKGFVKSGLLLHKKILNNAKELIKKYDIRPTDPNTLFGGMSGGNQQKVVVARELEKEHEFLLIAQPTRGVDIGAIEMIHNTILKQREQGKAILVVSAELSEVMALSDRIAVMYSGKIVDILDRKDATIEKLGILMAGGKLHE